MKKPFQIALSLLTLACGLGLGQASAATYYVAKTGSNAHSCAQAQSPSTPKHTINEGISCLAGGDTLIVQAGTYDEIVTDFAGIGGYTVPIPSGSSFAAPTTLKAETPLSVTLIVTSPPSGWDSIMEFDNGLHHVVFDGFVLDGQFQMENCVGVTSPTHHLRFQNMEIKRCEGQGFAGQDSKLTGFEFLNLHIHHIAWTGTQTTCRPVVCGNPPGQMCPGYCHAYYFYGTNHLIDGGHYHDNDGHALQWYAHNSTIRNLTVSENVVGVGLYGGGNELSNSVFYRNNTHVSSIATNTIIHNTIAAMRGDPSYNFGIYQHPGGAVNVIKNNLVVQQRVDSMLRYIYVEGGSGPSGNRLADGPQANVMGNLCDATMVGCAHASPTACYFVAPGSDFRPCDTAPTIDAGVTMADVPLDKAGQARPHPLTKMRDVGAYEYTLGGSPPPVVPAPKNLRLMIQTPS